MSDRTEYSRAYYERNKERVKARVYRYRSENPGKVAETNRRYQEKHGAERAAREKARRDGKRDEINGRQRERYRANRELYLDRRLRYAYGISMDQYRIMVDRQNGLCAICQSSIAGEKLVVDHNHATGAVRELLCSKCNYGIGFLRDDPELAVKAAEYLIRHRKED